MRYLILPSFEQCVNAQLLQYGKVKLSTKTCYDNSSAGFRVLLSRGTSIGITRSHQNSLGSANLSEFLDTTLSWPFALRSVTAVTRLGPSDFFLQAGLKVMHLSIYLGIFHCRSAELQREGWGGQVGSRKNLTWIWLRRGFAFFIVVL